MIGLAEFEEEFCEEDFAEVDALIEYLQSLPRSEVLILNPKRVQEMKLCCGAIAKMFRNAGCRAAVECKQHELEPGVGVIWIEGKEIVSQDTDLFTMAAGYADNTEVYSLENGKVRMTFTFYHFLVPIA